MLLPTQRGVVVLGSIVAAGIAWRVTSQEPRLGLLFLIGILLGVTLYCADFGFASAYRRLFVHGDSRAVRAQLVMLAVATLMFTPLLAAGAVGGREVSGAFAPVGVQVAVGAFLFGIGMQLGGGCGSGTLYAAGGGSPRTMITLAAFVCGSFWASLHMGWWQLLPAWDAVVLGEAFGWYPAAALQVVVVAILGLALREFARGRITESPAVPPRPLAGPWPLMAGALGLAVLNLLTLLVAGHPWTITWGFALWGAKAATWVGWDPASSPFWSAEFQRRALEGSVLEDVTSLMDIGILLGALAAAGLAGRFAPTLRLAPASVVAAVVGGLAMGYGARIAYGCNVGAFFSGVASTSLHGWLWIAAALPGVWVGIRLRPRFGLRD